MNCSLCSSKAVAHLRYSGQKLCKNHFTKLTEKRIRRTITKHKLLQRNDKVAVGVSGGKDSTTLLHILSEISTPLELHGVIVDEGIKGYRDESIKLAEKTLKSLDIEYTITSFKKKVGKELDQIVAENKDQSPCYYCGVFRRRLLNDAAKDWGADKLATGHNMDDEVQATFMNYIRGDFARQARIGAITPKGKGYVQRIKPLRDVPEKEIGLYAFLRGFKFLDDECPNAAGAYRLDLRDHLNSIESEHAGTKFSILKGADELAPILKKEFKGAAEVLKDCTSCGELSPNDVCKYCELYERVK